MKDFYYILGLAPTCSEDQIKEAYRKLSKKLHPDLNQGDEYFESRFRDIKEAFETLRDPLKRRIYDDQLSRFKESADILKQPKAAGEATPGTPRPVWRTAPRPKVRKRGAGLGLTLTLIVLGGILGIYLARSFFGNKAKTHPSVKDSIAVAPLALHKKHKRRHESKPLIAAHVFKKKFDTVKTVMVKAQPMQPLAPTPELVKPKTVKIEPLRPMIAKTWPDSDETHSDYLYTTFVHPNVTGVVKLRQQNKFNSNIIASIPANSKVYVLERGDTYYRVFYDHNIGFVPKWALYQK